MGGPSNFKDISVFVPQLASLNETEGPKNNSPLLSYDHKYFVINSFKPIRLQITVNELLFAIKTDSLSTMDWYKTLEGKKTKISLSNFFYNGLYRNAHFLSRRTLEKLEPNVFNNYRKRTFKQGQIQAGGTVKFSRKSTLKTRKMGPKSNFYFKNTGHYCSIYGTYRIAIRGYKTFISIHSPSFVIL